VIRDIGSLIKRCTCQHRVSQSKFYNSHSNENGEKSPGKSKNSGTNMLNNVSHKVAETKAEAIQTITSHRVQDTKKCVGTTHGKGPARASPRTFPSGRNMCPSSPLPLATVARRSGARCRTPFRTTTMSRSAATGACVRTIGQTHVSLSISISTALPPARAPRPRTSTHSWTCPCRISAAAHAHAWRHHASPHDPTRALSPAPTYLSAVRASKTPAGNEVRALLYR